MDLEQFRRAYMMSEGIGNTPIRGAERAINLAKSISKIPGAIKRDSKERNAKFHAREEAFKDIRENGLSSDALIKLFKNRRTLGNRTIDAVEKTADATVAAALSANELGQTAESIIGTNNTNLYGGQDLENGIRFVLRAKGITSKGLRLPGRMLRKIDGLMVGEGFGPEIQRGELKKAVEKGTEKVMPDMERGADMPVAEEEH